MRRNTSVFLETPQQLKFPVTGHNNTNTERKHKEDKYEAVARILPKPSVHWSPNIPATKAVNIAGVAGGAAFGAALLYTKVSERKTRRSAAEKQEKERKDAKLKQKMKDADAKKMEGEVAGLTHLTFGP